MTSRARTRSAASASVIASSGRGHTRASRGRTPCPPAGGEDVPIRAAADGVEEIGAAAEVPRVAAVVGVPESHLRVAGAGGELCRLADEQQSRDLLGVRRDRPHLLALLEVP